MPDRRVEGTYLAFDFGTRKIGVAVGESETGLCEPLTIIPAYKGHPHWPTLLKLCDDWRPVGCVVGWPLNMDGSTQHLTVKTRGFIKALKQHTNLPVYAMDERCTTVEARAQRFAEGGFKALQQDIDDHAAMIILNLWFRSSD